MNLDVRLPIGMMFTVFGVMITGFGLISDDAIYARSLGINMNLRWGVVLLAFGLIMLAFAARAEKERRASLGRPAPK